MNLTEISNKRLLDITAGELVSLIAAEIGKPNTLPEYVEIKQRNALLYAKSASKAQSILRWGRENNFIVRKRGGKYWNSQDLINLTEAYYEAVNK